MIRSVKAGLSLDFARPLPNTNADTAPAKVTEISALPQQAHLPREHYDTPVASRRLEEFSLSRVEAPIPNITGPRCNTTLFRVIYI